MLRPHWCWLLLVLMLLRPAQAYRRVQAERPAFERPRGPNLLILVGDDHAGGMLGIDGDPRRATPNLDRLAGQGVRFDRAYCNAPVCTASRQSFITGRYPHAVGVTQLMTPLPEEAVTLGDWMADLGFVTGAVGKMHFNSELRHGFAERVETADWRRWLKEHPPAGGDHRRPWKPFQDPAPAWLNAACRDAGLPEASMEGTYFADRAIGFLERHRDDPFVLVVGFHEPHAPFPFPRELAGAYGPEDFGPPAASEADLADQPRVFRRMTAEQARGVSAAYYTSLAFLDRQVGRILDALERLDLAEETIVVYWGDNGYLLGEHGRFEKHCLYEPAVRVPLIIRWKGRVEGGRAAAELVELVDVLPTLMELGGWPTPPDLHGRSLVPLLEGRPGAEGRTHVYSEYLENEEAMIRSDRYKLIVGSGRRIRQDGYATANPLPGPYERLYDLESDPGETTDRSGDPALGSVLDALRHELFLRMTGTRERMGPIPPGLGEPRTIRWCLVPRDRPVP